LQRRHGHTPAPARPAPKVLPPWKVLLHNDEVNEIGYVVETIQMLTTLPKEDAINRTLEATAPASPCY